MALVDTRRNKYFDMAKKRWREQGFDAGIEDILEKYRAAMCRQIASNKVNVLTTFLMIYMIVTIYNFRKILRS